MHFFFLLSLNLKYDSGKSGKTYVIRTVKYLLFRTWLDGLKLFKDFKVPICTMYLRLYVQVPTYL